MKSTDIPLLAELDRIAATQQKLFAGFDRLTELHKFSDPFAGISQSYASIAESLRQSFQFNHAFEEATKRMQEFENISSRATQSLNAAESWARQFDGLQTKFDDSFRRLTAQFGERIDFLPDDMLLSIQESVESPANKVISPKPAILTIAGNDVAISEAAVVAGVEVTPSTVGADKVVDVRERFNIWFKGLPPIAQLKVLFLVVYLLPALFEKLVDESVDKLLAAKNTQDQVAIVNHIVIAHGTEYIESLRCVRATSLKLRESSDGESPVVGMLSKSQAVQVMESKGAWSLVRHFDGKSGALTEGWAASSYLSRYKCDIP